jgi:membrane fusion protein (multidrug efflux system)
MNVRLIPLFAALLACGGGSEPPEGTAAGAATKHAPSTTATRVEVATIEASQPQLEVVRPGEVEGAREARLGAALGGFVEAVLVHNGATVKKGQALAYVDAGVHNAQAKLTKIEVDDAKRELERLESLGKSIASARVDTAKTRLARAEAQHALSRTQQARAVVRAPFAGVIVDLTVEKGEVVAPGAPIARLIQLDPAIVAVAVTDRDMPALVIGSAAQVTSSGFAGSVAGTIKRIQPAADLETRSFEVEVEVANADRRMLPGMIARVSFTSSAGPATMLIPQDFLVTHMDGNGVFVLSKDSRASWRPLELGAIFGTQIEIKSGLENGDKVVVIGQRTLVDDDELIVTREGRCCSGGRVVYDDATTRSPPAAPAKPKKAASNDATKPVPTAAKPTAPADSEAATR